MFFRLRGTNIRAGMSGEALRRVDLIVSVEYGTQVDTVKQALEDIIKADGRILTNRRGINFPFPQIQVHNS